ncbi:ArsR family transcriptional regulator [Promicromonospora sp. AC04]|uniref:ArsR/SmtB family transcription factor n=1 Tax=Promicromonospora sp. AC04 TaxID=2135723 RepID=UPI000D417B4A|nr:metalloregulator ArsR/SmtB family transcription factor [Promicromonospora sp. AC04]PUB24901.1 ArsR family transcriptional regulator [Promicromonospora sp. AC04]
MSKADLFESFARTGKALASGKRLELLELLAQGERPVQQLASVAGLNLTTTSAHLQLLRDAGLIVSRRDGTRVLYRLAGPDVAELVTVMFRVAERHRPEVAAAATRLTSQMLPDGVRIIDRAELLERSHRGEVFVLDVRPSEEYAAGHLPGAVSIPSDELAGRLAEIPADVEVAAYCRGRYCVLSYDAVHLLAEHGHAAHLVADGVIEFLADDVALTTTGAQAGSAP